MPAELRLAAEADHLIVTMTGSADFDCIEHALAAIVSDRRWPPTIPTIWDARQADVSTLDHATTVGLIQVRKALDSLRGRTRAAIVVQTAMDARALKVFTALAHDLTADVFVFQDFDAAVAWVRQPLSPLDSPRPSVGPDTQPDRIM